MVIFAGRTYATPTDEGNLLYKYWCRACTVQEFILYNTDTEELKIYEEYDSELLHSCKISLKEIKDFVNE